MKQPAQELRIPQKLRDVVLSKQCIAFIGSGLSAGAYDSWCNVVNELCERCGSSRRVTHDSPTGDYLDAAQDAKSCNESAYYAFLRDHFGRPATHASMTYDALLAIPFECYLTVNFDPLLALKSRTARIACDGNVLSYPALDRKRMTNRSVHYLHGFIGENCLPARGTIVFARDEFDSAYAANSSLMNMLLPTLENDPVVFIGCRLREPVMPRVFEICRNHQQTRKLAVAELQGQENNPPPRFIFLREPQAINANGTVDVDASARSLQAEEAYYRSLDIEPVWYSGTGSDHSELRYILENLAGLAEITPNYGWPGDLYGD